MKSDFAWLKQRARGPKSKAKVAEIEKWYREAVKEGVFSKSRRTFPVQLGPHTIWFRRNTAHSEADIYVELFHEKNHFAHPAFSGKGAKTVLDIGANEGYYTLQIKQNNPKCRIVAAEAIPSTFAMLKRNVHGNRLANVILVNKAVGKRNGTASFDAVENATAISAGDIKVIKRPWLKKGMVKKVRVPMVTLDTLMERNRVDHADILKLDVEGAEMDILRAGQKRLGDIDRIVVEYHSPKLRKELLSFLPKQGFRKIKEQKGSCGELYFRRK